MASVPGESSVAQGSSPVVGAPGAGAAVRGRDDDRLLPGDPGEDQRRGLVAEAARAQLAPQLLGLHRGAALLDLEHAEVVFAQVGAESLEAEGHHVAHGVSPGEGGVHPRIAGQIGDGLVQGVSLELPGEAADETCADHGAVGLVDMGADGPAEGSVSTTASEPARSRRCAPVRSMSTAEESRPRGRGDRTRPWPRGPARGKRVHWVSMSRGSADRSMPGPSFAPSGPGAAVRCRADGRARARRTAEARTPRGRGDGASRCGCGARRAGSSQMPSVSVGIVSFGLPETHRGGGEGSQVHGGDGDREGIAVHGVDLETQPGQGHGVPADAAPEVGDRATPARWKRSACIARDREPGGLLEAVRGEDHGGGELAELVDRLGAQAGLGHHGGDQSRRDGPASRSWAPCRRASFSRYGGREFSSAHPLLCRTGSRARTPASETSGEGEAMRDQATRWTCVG